MAVLAGLKLTLLLAMGLTVPPSNQARSQPQAQVAQAAAPAKAAEAVRSALLDVPQAQAAQQAPAPQAPAPQPAKDKPAQAESVLTIQQLKDRAETLDRQEQALKTLEADLNARLAKLQELETMLKGMLAEAKTIKDEKMRHLIDVYTNMKSKQAGTVLETLDENIAVKILAGMKGRQAGEILTNVSSKKAAKLSEELTKLQVGQELPDKP